MCDGAPLKRLYRDPIENKSTMVMDSNFSMREAYPNIEEVTMKALKVRF